MDQDPELQLEIVELGDANQATKGSPQGVATELNEAVTYKP
ncbi:hypothetical protein [Roseateles saccharophilus]|uniref:Uncharacterized protein n=1 Tax=Roseateles saccharophilus TaxID=304 RepID=A0A4R3U9P6_ROSSA|nr:hypothetical protein [Roseateles saccharophilus]TCU83062.1 hypothetical protein EV671_106012 [Roseateles saccharophilus]